MYLCLFSSLPVPADVVADAMIGLLGKRGLTDPATSGVVVIDGAGELCGRPSVVGCADTSGGRMLSSSSFPAPCPRVAGAHTALHNMLPAVSGRR